MIRGLPASIIAHAAFLGATYVSWPYWGSAGRTYVTEIEAVDVNFAELGEITNIAPLIQQETEPEEETAPEEPEEEVPEDDPVDEDVEEAEEDVSNAEEQATEPEDPDELMPDLDAEETPEEPEEEKPEEPKPEPKPVPNPPANPLNDFLNQSETTFKSEIETQRKKPEPKPKPPEEKPKTALKDAPKPAETRNRQGAGERSANVARLEALIYSRVKECWAGVDDLPYPERLNVRMKVELNQNGTIADLRLVDPKRRPLGSSPMGTAVDRALRAVNKCAPYRLPRDDYEDWSEMNINLGLAFEPD